MLRCAVRSDRCSIVLCCVHSGKAGIDTSMDRFRQHHATDANPLRCALCCAVHSGKAGIDIPDDERPEDIFAGEDDELRPEAPVEVSVVNMIYQVERV